MLTQPLSTLVLQYTNKSIVNYDNELNDYNKSQTLDELLERSIFSDFRLRISSERSHQCRIASSSLNDMMFYCRITKVKNDLLLCAKFEEILKVLYYPRQIDLISGFGSICVYDSGLRFGFNTSVTKHPDSGMERQTILPNYVYIHNGSKKGAKNLFKSLGLRYSIQWHSWDINKEFPYIEQDDFPAPLNALSPHHIENFLCIFENQL